ncbi:Acyl-CoA desaturase [Grifola frondosa]|uniref:Acyl-CoA desaturase n=1 Tax=Grifola frondosa TaxID=5627 RepID=A0A1C7M642_GRIFR|nr:Acyl-CoA desaturase [Grifola frondosa]
MSDQLPNSMTAKVWVDPYSLPKYDDISTIAGNAPSDVKQLTCNTLGAYGIGTNQECFAHSVGKKLKIVEINIDRDGEKMQCSTVVEVLVSKDMLNGAGMMHGGCVCYIIDNCASLPLVALGVLQKVNGVGVSQAMTVFFHSPASCDVVLTVVSTSIAFGSRIMNARCECPDYDRSHSNERMNWAMHTFKRIRWFNLAILTITPLVGLYGIYTTPLHLKTFVWACVYYAFSMIGITAGYHRLWSHRSYNASPALQYLLIVAGGSAVQGSCYWWARGHRSHHRFTDTDLDPYNAKRGLLYSHIGWMLVKPDIKPGKADISDLRKNAIVQWQHRWYFVIIAIFGYYLPIVVAGKLWGDWWGGLFYAGMLRITFVQHSTFCINSIAHYLGESPFDDKKTARDHLLSALLTMGEGYHNFHHQFPMDYRNAIRWYQYDPTKWFIAVCSWIGVASHLHVFPDNEIQKGVFTMQLKRLKTLQDSISWPADINDLPVVSWEHFKEQSVSRPLVIVSGFIHDVSSLVVTHPGGRDLLAANIGKDATAAFFGGFYEHSNAAHNVRKSAFVDDACRRSTWRCRARPGLPRRKLAHSRKRNRSRFYVQELELRAVSLPGVFLSFL